MKDAITWVLKTVPNTGIPHEVLEDFCPARLWVWLDDALIVLRNEGRIHVTNRVWWKP